jgi:hypothetical protein
MVNEHEGSDGMRKSTIAALIGAAAAGSLVPATAQAQRVYTFAETGSFSGQAIYAGYNMRTDFIGPIEFGDFGAQIGDGCNGFGNSFCAGSASTNPNTASPTAFAATSSSNLSDVIYTPASGSTSARASLYTGEIGASAFGAFRACPGYTCWIRGTSVAQLGDGLHFTIAGANASTHTPIGIVFDVDGIMGISPGGANPFAQGLLHVSENGNVSAEFLTQIIVGTATSSASGAWLSYSISPNTAGHVTFSGVYDLVSATHDLGIGYSLFVRSGESYADYYNTGKLHFVLPTNTSFTSDSGVFLTQAGGAVPEPQTWAMLTLGFALVGTVFRRRRALAAA